MGVLAHACHPSYGESIAGIQVQGQRRGSRGRAPAQQAGGPERKPQCLEETNLTKEYCKRLYNYHNISPVQQYGSFKNKKKSLSSQIKAASEKQKTTTTSTTKKERKKKSPCTCHICLILSVPD
jgi:hypothetical protein